MYDGIFGIEGKEAFEAAALDTFRYQYNYCPEYRRYCDLSGIGPEDVETADSIPFLPIIFFKQYNIISSADSSVNSQKIFYSSSTTGTTPSRHCVVDMALYRESYRRGFEYFYGKPSDYVILALLPSYLEREGSSLIYMADDLIRLSNSQDSGFYLYDYDGLSLKLDSLLSSGRRVLLLGVAFALLDFGESHRVSGSGSLIVMETGGMKGRKEELTKEELHRRLKDIFGVEKIHSEYGMCELLSQGYSAGDGLFFTPPWMKVIVRDLHDPYRNAAPGEFGVINIIDLANRNSCSFIETEDVGRVYEDGSFRVEGRLSGAERRGCNMLVE